MRASSASACSASSSSRRARRRASRSFARRAGSSPSLTPAFCSVTFGAGGSTREGTLSTVLEFRAEGMEAAPAHFVHRAARARRLPRCSRATSRTASATSSRCAATCRPDRASTAISGSRASSSRSSARETGDHFHIDVAAYPECHPQARSPQDDLDALQAQDRRGRQLGDHAVFLQRGRLLALRRRVPRGGHHGADRSGHHADQQLREARALLRRVRRRDPALDPAGASKATATTSRRSARSGSTSSPSSGDGLLARGAPGLHFYTLNQASLTTTIWQRHARNRAVARHSPAGACQCAQRLRLRATRNAVTVGGQLPTPPGVNEHELDVREFVRVDPGAGVHVAPAFFLIGLRTSSERTTLRTAGAYQKV